MALYIEAIIDSNKKKKRYFEHLNSFRAEYFNEPGIGKYKLKHWNMIQQQGLIPVLLYENSTSVGMAEISVGSLYGKEMLNVCTVYIDPQHRGKGLATAFYRWAEQEADEEGINFGIQVEQSSMIQNKTQFKKMGFHWASAITDWGNEMAYNQTTWVLYTKHYLKRIMPIDNCVRQLEETA
jgi:GNAT superfamily N-acetyltransferase